MRSMIRHHWTAVREAETCLDEGLAPRSSGPVCSSIREVQLDEIEQMKTWLAVRRAGWPPKALNTPTSG
ncbi:MAG TPA: DUF305 domain-containing protein [Jiangellales bacterium]|jgi:uncharacterized protein (DUF305 family)|nr:DUF305 domain-containing protein [Jiangellales bacterium]